jgi:hypothetical protein
MNRTEDSPDPEEEQFEEVREPEELLPQNKPGRSRPTLTRVLEP